MGYEALYSVTSGTNNDAMGYKAGYKITTGIDNLAMGYGAIEAAAATTGNENTAIGYDALNSLTGGIENTMVGAYAGSYFTTPSYNTGVGDGALAASSATAQTNTALGYEVMSATTGNGNTGLGSYIAMGSCGTASGSDNTLVGHYADQCLSTGQFDTAIGGFALNGNQAGSYVTVAGAGAAQAGGTSNVTAAGYDALFNTTVLNDAFGYEAGYYITTGVDNVMIGAQAMYGVSGTPLIGAAPSGSYNTAVGYQALYTLQGAAEENTALGAQAGQAGTAITTGSTDTFIGYQAQSNGATYTNGTAIGSSAILTATNSIVLGNNLITTLYGKVTLSAISDRRLKKDIIDLPPELGLSFIEKLKPVSYRYNNGDETQRYGFIAQDLEQALPTALQNTVETAEPEHGLALLMRENNQERTYRVSYGELYAPIVKAIQENQIQIVENEKEYERLRKFADPALRDQVQNLSDQFDKEFDRLLFVLSIIGVVSVTIGYILGRTYPPQTKRVRR